MHRRRTRTNGDPHVVKSTVHSGHKLSKTTEYRSWGQMKARCYNKKHHAHARYGGRNITVCERWANSFENFIEDMGQKPTSKHSLDRVNPNGNYEPSNCRWADHNEQAMTRRHSNPYVGVYFERSKKSWRATLQYNGKRVLYKRFKDFDDALKARQEAEKVYLGG